MKSIILLMMSLLFTMAIGKDDHSPLINYSRVNAIHNSHLATISKLPSNIGAIEEITTQAKYHYSEADLNLYPEFQRHQVYMAQMQDIIQFQGEAIEEALNESYEKCGLPTYIKDISVGYEDPKPSEDGISIEGISKVHAVITLKTNCPTH